MRGQEREKQPLQSFSKRERTLGSRCHGFQIKEEIEREELTRLTSPVGQEVFLLLLIISRTTIPKLYTSALVDSIPFCSSGAM